MSLGFSPPDISQEEIDEVIDTLRSGWITTGPKTKLLEQEIIKYTNSQNAVCLNSATAAMEMILRLFEIGEGDEVITTPYTYSATAAVILHVGATPVFADVKEDSFLIDSRSIKNKITDKTKAIIPVDIAGYPCDYDEIFKIAQDNRLFKPKKGSCQEKLGRILILADAAHSLGALYKGKTVGSVADFTCFSFHAVKNVTTAEGGVVTWKNSGLNSDEIYKELKTLSLHGQSKDAFAKNIAGSWEYDILFPGYKCNMTDISASLGLIQLQRYKDKLLNDRITMFQDYLNRLSEVEGLILPGYRSITGDTISSCHLFMLRVEGISPSERNQIIKNLAEKGIPTNVHYKPLPLLTAYSKLGYVMDDYPNAYNMYKNQITLPLHTLLTNEDMVSVASALKEVLKAPVSI